MERQHHPQEWGRTQHHPWNKGKQHTHTHTACLLAFARFKSISKPTFGLGGPGFGCQMLQGAWGFACLLACLFGSPPRAPKPAGRENKKKTPNNRTKKVGNHSVSKTCLVLVFFFFKKKSRIKKGTDPGWKYGPIQAQFENLSLDWSSLSLGRSMFLLAYFLPTVRGESSTTKRRAKTTAPTEGGNQAAQLKRRRRERESNALLQEGRQGQPPPLFFLPLYFVLNWFNMSWVNVVKLFTSSSMLKKKERQYSSKKAEEDNTTGRRRRKTTPQRRRTGRGARNTTKKEHEKAAPPKRGSTTPRKDWDEREECSTHFKEGVLTVALR